MTECVSICKLKDGVCTGCGRTLPEIEAKGNKMTEPDIVDKHDNPWVQIEQLQMEIERLGAIIAAREAWIKFQKTVSSQEIERLKGIINEKELWREIDQS